MRLASTPCFGQAQDQLFIFSSFFSTQQANSSLTSVQREEKISLVSWQCEGVLSMAMTLGRFVACPSGDNSVEAFVNECVCVYV